MGLELKGNQRHGINHIAYSFDGRLMATSDVDMWVGVESPDAMLFERDFASKEHKVRSLQRVHGLAFSHDGARLYVAGADRIVAIAVPGGEIEWQYRPPRFLGFLVVPPTAVSASPGGLVAAAFENGVVAVWDPIGELRQRWHSSQAPRSIGFLPDGDRFVGTDSFSLTRWDASSGRLQRSIRLEDRAYGIAVAAHTGVLATRGVRHVTVWDGETLAPLLRLDAPKGLPILAFHPDEREFAVPSTSAVHVYDFDGSIKRRYDISGARVVSIAYGPKGGRLAVGCSDRSVRLL